MEKSELEMWRIELGSFAIKAVILGISASQLCCVKSSGDCIASLDLPSGSARVVLRDEVFHKSRVWLDFVGPSGSFSRLVFAPGVTVETGVCFAVVAHSGPVVGVVIKTCAGGLHMGAVNMDDSPGDFGVVEGKIREALARVQAIHPRDAFRWLESESADTLRGKWQRGCQVGKSGTG